MNWLHEVFLQGEQISDFSRCLFPLKKINLKKLGLSINYTELMYVVHNVVNVQYPRKVA